MLPTGGRSAAALRFPCMAAASAEGSARILLVDDEHAVQTLLTYPLRKDGYEVISARDGRPRFASPSSTCVAQTTGR